MLDTDTTPDTFTAAALANLEAQIRPLPGAAARCLAWARVGYNVGAQEIYRTPGGERTSMVLFGWGAMMDAVEDLEQCGVERPIQIDPLELDRNQARRLFPHLMERVMWETGAPETPAQRAVMATILNDVADSYIALVGHLPDRYPTEVDNYLAQVGHLPLDTPDE